MQVTVEHLCGRCGKKTAKTVDLELANKINNDQKTEKEELEKLKEEILTLLNEKDNPPELMVAHLNKETGEYQITAMSNLCSKPGVGKGKRGCRERIVTLMKEVRLENKPAKKKNKPTEPEATSESTPKEEE